MKPKTVQEHAKRIAEIIERVENRSMAVDGPVGRMADEMRDQEWRELWQSAKEIAAGSCQHPRPQVSGPVAYAGTKGYKNLRAAGITNVAGSQLLVDDSITDFMVHFWHEDGTCTKVNV